MLLVATLHPFQALRPAPGLARSVASPPYDVINTAEARAIYVAEPMSYVQVSRPEVRLPEGTDEHDDVVYSEGRRALQDMINAGHLVRANAPGLWLYAQTMGNHTQVGIVACASVDEYDRDVIKKHEKTRADKEDDRTRHINEMGAHDEPVFLTYRAVKEVDAIVAQASANKPDEDFLTGDEVRHQIWSLTAEQQAELVRLFQDKVPALYVADGHHRSAAASRVKALGSAENAERGYFLSVIFPDDQMQILAYNRLVRDTQGRSHAELLELFKKQFDVQPASQPAPNNPRSFGLYLGGAWYHLNVKTSTFDDRDPVARLDCSICQDQILGPMFGITDPRRDKNVDFVGGIRGAGELERRVNNEGWTLALHLYPTQIRQLLEVSDASLLMPPKSTWFEPKLRSGLFVHTF